jgi:hypothetical protein
MRELPRLTHLPIRTSDISRVVVRVGRSLIAGTVRVGHAHAFITDVKKTF